MKRLLIYIIGVSLLVVSCDIVHRSGNGDLDGFWQLKAVDTLTNNHTCDMRESQIAWAVQGALLEVRKVDDLAFESDIVFQFEHYSDSLLLHSPYIVKRDVGDVLVTDVSLLQPFGINDTEEGFRVLKLNGSKMILQSKTLRLYFRRY
jgi:hypothetical protein